MCYVVGMHEVTVAQSVVDAVLGEASAQGARAVTSVTLIFGELSLINTEQISFWIASFFEGSLAEGAEILIEGAPGKVECRDCGAISEVSVDPDDKLSHYLVPDFSCAHCGSPHTFICQGREMLIKSIQITK